jgi:hypothetical protein
MPPPVRNQGPGTSLPGPDADHPLQGAARYDHERRAINVQLARVTSGQSRALSVYKVGWSTASSTAICPIPKLIVRVRFPSPAPTPNPQIRWPTHRTGHTSRDARIGGLVPERRISLQQSVRWAKGAAHDDQGRAWKVPGAGTQPKLRGPQMPSWLSAHLA